MSSTRDRKLELALKHELRSAGMPDRDACVDAETLGAWADGGLDTAQMASVEVHVATCARCQAIVGATARTAPALPVSDAADGFSLWKWWLAPIAAGAAAVTLWMVVPQEMQSPPAPASVIESKTDAPIEVREEASQARESGVARDTSPAAIGAVAAAPPAAAPGLAGAMLQKNARALAPIEIVSPDPRRRWRVIAGTVERSEDSGTSWLQVQNTSGDTINGGTAPTASICWLIGANGLVLLSADGTTFARVPVPDRVNLTGITATDARSATVTAADGRQFRTDDAGRTWRQN